MRSWPSRVWCCEPSVAEARARSRPGAISTVTMSPPTASSRRRRGARLRLRADGPCWRSRIRLRSIFLAARHAAPALARDEQRRGAGLLLPSHAAGGYRRRGRARSCPRRNLDARGRWREVHAAPAQARHARQGERAVARCDHHDRGPRRGDEPPRGGGGPGRRYVPGRPPRRARRAST